MVVQRSHHTSLMQSFGIALIVFDGISIGLEDIPALVDLPGGGGSILQQIIVIAVYTSYHVLSQTGAKLVHQDRLLALAQGFV